MTRLEGSSRELGNRCNQRKWRGHGSMTGNGPLGESQPI